jgi:predicted  nucleic acid-binding Zn-ribbon protein
MDVEAEIEELRRRVGDLEGAVNVLAGQMGRLHPEIKGLNERTAKRFDTIATSVGQMVSRLDTLNTQVWSLRDDLPGLIAAAVAEHNRRDRQ